MAYYYEYSIIKSSGTLLTTVAPQTLDGSSTSLTLFGQGAVAFGEPINNNFIHLMEHFAAGTAPAAALDGQLWYNSTTQTINLSQQGNWAPLATEAWVLAALGGNTSTQAEETISTIAGAITGDIIPTMSGTQLQLALAPALVGTPGTYNYASIVVDQKGRVISASTGYPTLQLDGQNGPVTVFNDTRQSSPTLAFSANSDLSNAVNLKTTGDLYLGTDRFARLSDLSALSGGGTGSYSSPLVSVKTFGAKGDGVTNDTAAITTADAWCRDNGFAKLYFPAGTYMVSSLTLYSGTHWEGEGRGAPVNDTAFTAPQGGSIIRQIVGSNTDLLYGANSNANWGSSAPTGYPEGFTLSGLTLDGNWNNGSGNTVGSGLAFFGNKPVIRDLYICNCANHGIRSGWIAGNSTGSPGFGTWTMEGLYSNVRIDTVGQHGWWDAGPHDSTVIGCIIVDASRSTSNSYDCFFLDVGSSPVHFGSHGWTRHATAGGASVWAKYALHVNGSSPTLVGCQFEGAYSAAAYIGAGTTNTDPTTRFYGAGGGTTVLLGGSACTGNIIRGVLGPVAANASAATGITLSSTGGDSVSNNTIDVDCQYQENGPIFFGSANAGGNIIRIRCRQGTNMTYTGAPQASDDFEISGTNTQGTFKFRNGLQTASLTTASGVGVTNTVANVVALTLAPGTWDVWGIVNILPAAGASVTDCIGAISTTSATLPATSTGESTSVVVPVSGQSWTGSTPITFSTGRAILSLTSAATVYLCATAQMASGSAVAGGFLGAQRL